MKWIFIWFSLFGWMLGVNSNIPDIDFKNYMISKVNEIRSKGCKCGRSYMHPVKPVVWNETLYRSAEAHARDMTKNNFFAHFSNDGLDIGDRLQRMGYDWQVAGENLGEGQVDFDEVLQDWIKSPSHCKMLMHPKVTEMGVAKFGKYWVQHFGRPI